MVLHHSEAAADIDIAVDAEQWVYVVIDFELLLPLWPDQQLGRTVLDLDYSSASFVSFAMPASHSWVGAAAADADGSLLVMAAVVKNVAGRLAPPGQLEKACWPSKLETFTDTGVVQ